MPEQAVVPQQSYLTCCCLSQQPAVQTRTMLVQHYATAGLAGHASQGVEAAASAATRPSAELNRLILVFCWLNPLQKYDALSWVADKSECRFCWTCR